LWKKDELELGFEESEPAGKIMDVVVIGMEPERVVKIDVMVASDAADDDDDDSESWDVAFECDTEELVGVSDGDEGGVMEDRGKRGIGIDIAEGSIDSESETLGSIGEPVVGFGGRGSGRIVGRVAVGEPSSPKPLGLNTLLGIMAGRVSWTPARSSTICRLLCLCIS